MNLKDSVKKVPRISNGYQKKLRRLGIKTVGELLFHFPHRYEDFSKISQVKNLKLNQEVCVKGEVTEVEGYRTPKKGVNITKVTLKDETGPVQAIWFNQPYLKETLDTKREVCLCGKFELGKDGPVLSNPVYEKLGKTPQIHTGRLVPVYPETEGVTSRWLRYILYPLVHEYAPKIPETLPEKIRDRENLMEIKKALKEIHWPSSEEKAQQARTRFSFEELFLLELKMLREKKKTERKKALPVPFHEKTVQKFVTSLPFELTGAQRKTAWQILQDMEREKPMSRLLQGDVGAGKTIVAAIAALNASKENFQVALMAPTEILARQHFASFTGILKGFNVPVSLLTGSESRTKKEEQELEWNKKDLLKEIKRGKPGIFIGTHALIQKKVKFKKLALVIIDEQHRFGVNQRAKLRRVEPVPHLLSMTATPIPRSLALTAYGDLNISLIDELPAGRKEIETEIVPPKNRKRAYEIVKKEVGKEHQAFIICPRIKTTDKKSNWEEVKSVEEEYEKLKKEVFPDLKIKMLHGQLEPGEKEKIMKSFEKGETDILVSTSVVEVGVDVPNATVMIIEGAERFGLAQLHQFRGRIGRSKHQAYCFLFTTSSEDTEKERLKALARTNNGFKLAEKDLKIRGPGDFLGNRQSGIPDLAMSSLENTNLIKKTRACAKNLLEESPDLKKYPVLRKRLNRFREKVHLE